EPLVLYFGTVLLGMTAGVTVSMLLKAGMKWSAAGLGLALLPVFVIAMGSLRNSLLAGLIASMCVGLDINPFFNDKYMDPHKGIEIPAVTVVLVGCLGLLCWRAITRRAPLRFFPIAMVPLGVVLLAAALSSIQALYPLFTWRYIPLAATCVLVCFYA